MSDRELNERRQALAWIRQGPPDRGAGNLTTQMPQGWPKSGIPVQLPIEHFSPPGAFPVDTTSDAIITGASEITMMTVAIPSNQVLRISAIGMDADDDAALAVLRWTAYVNGAPVPGLSNQVAGIGSVSYPVPILINIPGSAVLTIKGLNTINSMFQWTVIVRLIGYLFTAQRS